MRLTAWNQAHHLIIICETFVTMISGFPRYRVIFPDTATVLPSYCCGFENCPALAEGIQAVSPKWGQSYFRHKQITFSTKTVGDSSPAEVRPVVAHGAPWPRQ